MASADKLSASLLWLHMSFWAYMLALLGIVTFWSPVASHSSTVIDGVLLVVTLSAAICFYVSLGVLASRVSSVRWQVWVGIAFLFGPIGALVAYYRMWRNIQVIAKSRVAVRGAVNVGASDAIEREALSELRNLRKVIGNINTWSATSYSIDKAYVCAFVAKLAYHHIPQFEVEANERFKVIPCDIYKQLASYGARDVRQLINQSEGEYQSFVIERRDAIIVGLKVGELIFVGVRGTKYSFDWKFNLDARRHGYAEYSEAKFHRGFFAAMSGAARELHDELIRLGASPATSIYVSGHSLGGAVAAIAHAVWARCVLLENQDYWSATHLSIHSCYTFGMPRYGNFPSVMTFKKPYHIYNEGDIVPGVPLSLAGYVFANPPTEFRANGATIEISRFRHTMKSWILALWGRLTFRPFTQYHQMDLYLKRLRERAPAASDFRTRLEQGQQRIPVSTDVPIAETSTWKTSDLPVEDSFMDSILERLRKHAPKKIVFRKSK